MSHLGLGNDDKENERIMNNDKDDIWGCWEFFWAMTGGH
jgi:hypothetical protein